MLGARDTSPAVEAWRDEQLRALSPTEKLARVAALTRMLRAFARADVRASLPTASDAVVHRVAARRWMDEALLVAAYGAVEPASR